MHYNVGDAPTGVVFLLPDDIDEATVMGAQVRVAGVAKTTVYSSGTMTVSVGSLPTAGVVPVTATLTLQGGGTSTVSLEPIVVEAPTGWHTIDSIRRRWADAPEDDEILATLLDTARIECIAYLDGITADPVPTSWREAQYLAARAWWQAGRVNRDGDALGGGDSVLRVWSLDGAVKRLLVPQRRIPVIV